MTAFEAARQAANKAHTMFHMYSWFQGAYVGFQGDEWILVVKYFKGTEIDVLSAQVFSKGNFGVKVHVEASNVTEKQERT